MQWNWIFVDASARSSHYGPGFPTRAAAIRDTLPMVDVFRSAVRGSTLVVDDWEAGRARDDTIFFGSFVCGLYCYEGDGIEVEANLWLADFRGRMV